MKFMLVSKDQKGEGLILGGSHSSKIFRSVPTSYDSDYSGSKEAIWGHTPIATFRDGTSRGCSRHLGDFYDSI